MLVPLRVMYFYKKKSKRDQVSAGAECTYEIKQKMFFQNLRMTKQNLYSRDTWDRLVSYTVVNNEDKMFMPIGVRILIVLK